MSRTLWAGLECSHCGTIQLWDKANPTTLGILSSARAAGWTLGEQDVCPACNGHTKRGVLVTDEHTEPQDPAGI